MSFIRFAPLAVFAVLAGFFGYQLFNKEDGLRSALLDKPAPEFQLANLQEGGDAFTSEDLKTGRVSIVNLWASWCVPCRAEHPELMALADQGVAQMFAINYKDEPEKAKRFLTDLGDPFDKTGVDDTGREALRWGLSGVPETFVIDGNGVIVYKHVGPIQNDDLQTKILPAIEAARERS
ncbi:MAG: DsbE family thiol:disulfide interchange protein [Pseudomonadota bacterium]